MQHSSQAERAAHLLQMDSLGDAAPTVSRPLAAATALVVDPSLTEALAAVALLTGRGFEVTVAETFIKAKERLNVRVPAVLITEVRLGEYNGLHLVLRGKAHRPSLAALVTSAVNDPVLQADAEAMGATFLVKPIDEKHFIAAVMRTLFQRDRSEGPVRAPFERRSQDRRASFVIIAPDRRHSERRRDISNHLREI
jgi:two-component system response regulator RegA